MRTFLQIVLPLMTPLAIYLGWLYFRGRAQGRKVIHWEDGPWFWALVVGFMLTVASFIGWAAMEGAEPYSTYQTPRFENGRIIPGEMTPPPKSD